MDASAAHILTDTVERLSTATSVEQVTEAVAHSARVLMGADGATFVLREDDKCFYADEDAIGPLWKGSRFPLTACISGWAMLHKETVVVPDIYLDERIPHDAYRPTFVNSLVMVPIREADPIGALGAYWSDHHVPTAEQLRVQGVLANSAAVALENLELRGAVVRRSTERDDLESALRSLVHDLRNPLGAMMSYAELIELDPGNAEKVQRFAAYLVEAGDRMDRQIDSVLALYRITSATPAPEHVDLSALARELADELTRNAPRKVDVDDGLGAVMDPTLARLMMQNLLENAVKYSGRTVDPHIEVRRSGPHTFLVRDNGAGFDAAAADRIFRPLVRLQHDHEFPGTGLGLASVARIVELHGGRVTADGAKGQGATFTVTLPTLSA